MIRRVVIALVFVLGVARDVRSEEQPKGTAAEPELVTRGYAPWLSPNNKYLAFLRVGLDLENRDARGQPQRRGVLHIRDLTTSTESPATDNGDVTGWSGDELVILGDGQSVRVTQGDASQSFPDSPADLHTPSWTRSRDGRRVAYTVRGGTINDMMPTTAPAGRKHTIYLVEPDKKPRPLLLGAHVNRDQARGMLAFSPSGRHLAFRLGFMHYGQLPHPRIGVIDLASDECTWVADEAAGSRRESTRPSGPTAWATWDANETRFVFVKTAGAKKRDIYTATADGKDVRRLTIDGGWKATPCLDPSGERCAYWVHDPSPAPETTDAQGPSGLFPDGWETGPHLLRVVMLKTGAIVDVPTPSRGSGADLQWSSDGRHLWFAWTGHEGAGMWRIAAQSGPSTPIDTPVVNRTPAQTNPVLEALASDDFNEAEAALRRAWRNHNPDVTAAVVDLLRRWTRAPRSGHQWTLTMALGQRRALAAIPILLDAVSNEAWTSVTSGLLLDWDVEDAVPAWRLLAKSPDVNAKGWAVVALARYGGEPAWLRVRERLQDKDPDARDAVARALAHVRDANSVDVLIPLVDDEGYLYTSDTRVVVGDHAAESLAKITGEKFGRNQAKWSAWWEAAGKKLPAATGGKR